MDRRNSAFVMPKCVVIDPAVTWGSDIRPQTRWADTVIYEAHVKGMTATRSDLPAPLRGSFAGLADPRVIAHLVRLGVTALELLPVQALIDTPPPGQQGPSTYRGITTHRSFRPHTTPPPPDTA